MGMPITDSVFGEKISVSITRVFGGITMRLFIITALFANASLFGEGYKNMAIAIITDLKIEDMLIDKNAPPEYVAKKFDKRKKLIAAGVVPVDYYESELLYVMAVREGPGDIDPVVFIKTEGRLKMSFSITGLDETGLETDARFVKEMALMNKWLDGIKGRE